MFKKITAPLATFFHKYPDLLMPIVILTAALGFSILSIVGQALFTPGKINTNNVAQIEMQSAYPNPKILLVQSVTPSTGTNALPKNITIMFNDDVDPHEIAHAFSIVPKLEGDFSRGSTSKEVIFTPKGKFDPNITYSFQIDQSALSTNGWTMRASFGSFFNTKVDKPNVQFVSDSVAGRLLSFSSTSKQKIEVNIENRNQQVNVSLYTSTPEKLLTYMRYFSDSKYSEYSYQYYYDKYLNSEIKHTLQDQVKSLMITEPNPDQKVEIPVPNSKGIYYLEARGSTNEFLQSVYLVVSDLGVIMRQDDQKVVLSSFNTKTGSRLDDKANVTFYNLEQKTNILLQSELNSLQSYNLPFDQRLDLISVANGDDVAIIPVKLADTQADLKVDTDLDKAYQAFIYTDRPIYKPTDTIYFRGIIRKDKDALYSLPNLNSVRISLASFNLPSDWMNVPVDEHGSFSGKIEIKNEEGEYKTLDISNKNFRNNYLSLSIKNYIKPEFEISAEPAQSEYLSKDTLQFTVSGKYFDGKPLANKQINYSAYSNTFYESEKAVYGTNFNITSQGMCGVGFDDSYIGEAYSNDQTVTLDQNGTATISLDPDKSNNLRSQEITLVAQTKDSNSNELKGAAKAIVHQAEFNIFFPPSSAQYKENETVIVPFYAESLQGEKIVDKEFNYALVKYNGQTTDALVSGKVTTNSEGMGEVRFMPPASAPNQYLDLLVSAQDLKGNQAQGSKYISIYKPVEDTEKWWLSSEANAVNLKIRSGKNSYKVGDTIELSVNSNDELDTLVTLERGRIYAQQIVHLTKGDNTVRIPVNEEFSPSATVVFSYFINNRYYSEGLSLNIPAMHKLLSVTIATDKNKYLPTEKAEVKVSIKNAKQQPVQAQFSLGIIDKAIYALRKSALPELHSSLFFYRPRSTNASSSLTWVGQLLYGDGRGGGGGGGEGGLSKDIDTLHWAPTLATDENGEYVTLIDLKGISASWRAQVYASTDTTEVGERTHDFIVTE